MLYTVVPLERIYSNRAKSILDEYKVQGLMPKEELEFRDIPIVHGKITARRDGDRYVVNQINSTDMTDYLNTNYWPGQEIDITDTKI